MKDQWIRYSCTQVDYRFSAHSKELPSSPICKEYSMDCSRHLRFSTSRCERCEKSDGQTSQNIFMCLCLPQLNNLGMYSQIWAGVGFLLSTRLNIWFNFSVTRVYSPCMGSILHIYDSRDHRLSNYKCNIYRQVLVIGWLNWITMFWLVHQNRRKFWSANKLDSNQQACGLEADVPTTRLSWPNI